MGGDEQAQDVHWELPRSLSGRTETAIANPEEESPCPTTALEPSSSPGACTVSLNPVLDPLSKVACLPACDRHHISL